MSFKRVPAAKTGPHSRGPVQPPKRVQPSLLAFLQPLNVEPNSRSCGDISGREEKRKKAEGNGGEGILDRKEGVSERARGKRDALTGTKTGPILLDLDEEEVAIPERDPKLLAEIDPGLERHQTGSGLHLGGAQDVVGVEKQQKSPDGVNTLVKGVSEPRTKMLEKSSPASGSHQNGSGLDVGTAQKPGDDVQQKVADGVKRLVKGVDYVADSEDEQDDWAVSCTEAGLDCYCEEVETGRWRTLMNALMRCFHSERL
jgi:hypothetical protein